MPYDLAHRCVTGTDARGAIEWAQNCLAGWLEARLRGADGGEPFQENVPDSCW